MTLYEYGEVMRFLELYGCLERAYGVLQTEFDKGEVMSVSKIQDYARHARINLGLLEEEVPERIRNCLPLDPRDLEALCEKAELL